MYRDAPTIIRPPCEIFKESVPDTGGIFANGQQKSHQPFRNAFEVDVVHLEMVEPLNRHSEQVRRVRIKVGEHFLHRLHHLLVVGFGQFLQILTVDRRREEYVIVPE